MPVLKLASIPRDRKEVMYQTGVEPVGREKTYRHHFSPWPEPPVVRGPSKRITTYSFPVEINIQDIQSNF